MQKPARFISFSSGVVSAMRTHTVVDQIGEAITRCENMDEEANLLDENYKIVARVKVTPGAMNGYAVFKPE